MSMNAKTGLFTQISDRRKLVSPTFPVRGGITQIVAGRVPTRLEVEKRRCSADAGPIDRDAIQERQRIITALRAILNNGTVEELKDAMRVFGLSEKSPEWTEALKIWDVERGRI